MLLQQQYHSTRYLLYTPSVMDLFWLLWIARLKNAVL